MSSLLDSIILQKLQDFARRRRSLIIVRGVFAAVAMLFATMIVVAVVDLFVPLLPDWIRWVLSAAMLGIAWRQCVQQLLHAPDERQIARIGPMLAVPEKYREAVETSCRVIAEKSKKAERAAALPSAAKERPPSMKIASRSSALALAALGALTFSTHHAAAQADEFAPQPPVQAKSPQEEAKTFQLPPGYRLELVLSEPEIKEPGVVAFDGDGRMFVAELRGYMQDIDGKNQLDKISRVSLHWSSRGDGVYDRHGVFIDNLVLPRMLVALDKGRIIVGETNTNDLFIYTDTNGDGVSDKKEPFYAGGGRGGNLEHQPNGLVWALDNGLYSTYNNY